ncbi:SDR family NAD(P)-dependent oxidoreductase [Streptomyces sioyaensis]|uniref:SDR family NAD(P)-dependent oxidoreductase n=1 Tax=Streptomyces sioyaensis TaxID=67364 RepID=UPI0037AF5D31
MVLAHPRQHSPNDRSVVITGASSGLGRECALHLDRLGFRVFAGVRRTEDAEALTAASPSGQLRPLMLDVTCEDSIRDAAAQVAHETCGTGLWGLVNNAGICVSASLECVRSEQLRRQLETNLVGHFAMTRALLPLSRKAKGRIINVSSGLGRITSPYLGAYASSQFAKEGLSDALRRELRPFGVAVVVSPRRSPTPSPRAGRRPATASAATRGPPVCWRDCFRMPCWKRPSAPSSRRGTSLAVSLGSAELD